MDRLHRLVSAGSLAMKSGMPGTIISLFRGSRKSQFMSVSAMTAWSLRTPSIYWVRLIPEITIKHISQTCCGMGGAYGFDKSNYKRALEIRSKLVGEIHENFADRIVTDCGGCKLQIEAGCGLAIEHPIMLLQ